MNKILASLSIVLATISNVHAENRLFPTDILHQGEVDGAASVDNDTHSSSISFHGNPGSQSTDLTTESAQVRYGLGYNLHIGAALRHNSQGITYTDYSNPSAHFMSTSSEGNQNPSLWAKYGFINDNAKQFSLSGDLKVSPNTTGTPSLYTGQLTAGWKNNDTLRLYGIFSAAKYRSSNAAGQTGITVGAYKEILKDVTLIPHASLSRIQATNTYSSATQSGMGLSADIQTFRNTYLRPDISLYRNSARNSKDGFFHQDSTGDGIAIGLGVYHLF